MSRDGSNIYSAPAGTLAVSGTTIESAKYNAFVNDLVADANLPRPIVAGGTGATTAGAALVNFGLTATAAELNTLDGITATVAELNILDGVTATAAELNHVDGVTSPIQTQLNAKQAAGNDLTAIEALPGTGIAVRTASDTWAQRQITSADGSVTITNPGGVAGNIDLSVTTGGVSAATAASSGTAVDPVLTIPATATRLWIMFDAVSLNGTDDLLVQIGDSGGIENTGYISGSRETASSSTAGFIAFLGNAARAATGIMELVKGAGNQWFASHSIYSPTITSSGGGSKTLSNTLDRVRIIPSGANSFDGAGTITVRWA